MPYKIESLIGQTFGRGIVIADGPPAIKPNGRRAGTSVLRCQCGKIYKATNNALKTANTRSCGCLEHDTLVARNTKHGFAKRGSIHRVYKVWCGIVERTTNPNSSNAKNYIKRGLVICEAWLEFPN